MSSILEALKKAERESTPERGEATPWSAPLPEPSPYQQRKRKWWLPLGIVVIGCVCAAFFWQVRRHDQPPLPPIRDRAPSPASKAPAATLPLAPKKQVPPAAALQKAAGDTSASTIGAATVVPVEPAIDVPPAAPPPAASKPQSPPLPKPQKKLAARTAAPVAASAETTESRPSAAEPTPRPAPVAVPPPEERIKNYRSDQRIELQALVWGPEAAARFVVINNRLIKEGGSIDNITVVRINRDDVLLSEGSDRWHEKFKIR